MSKNVKNKPELKQPKILDQFSHEDGFLDSKDVKLTWFDKLILYFLSLIIIGLFIIVMLKIIIN